MKHRMFNVSKHVERDSRRKDLLLGHLRIHVLAELGRVVVDVGDLDANGNDAPHWRPSAVFGSDHQLQHRLSRVERQRLVGVNDARVFADVERVHGRHGQTVAQAGVFAVVRVRRVDR